MQIAFGDFTFDGQRQLLWRRGEPVGLGSRTVPLLACLLRRRGEVVDKAELIAAAWGDQAVEESNLSVQMAALRRALGKDPAGRDWIATVERVGYRFLPALLTSTRLGQPGLPTLEVGLSPEGCGPDVIADRETDEIIAGLSLLSSLVTSRSGERWRQPDYRLAGTVGDPAGGGGLRVRLLDGSTGRILWAESLAALAPGQLVAPLARIVASVEERVHRAETRRSLAERPGSEAPYDLYLRARALIRTGRHDDNTQALALLLKALEVEPHEPRYLAAAAETLHTRRLCGWPELTGRDQALRLGFARRAWEGAEHDADSLCYAGNALFTSGEPELGLTLTELAAEMNPYSPMVLGCAGHSHLWLGDLEVARSYYERAIGIAPHAAASRFAYSSLASVQNIAGQAEQALATAQRGRAISPGYSGMHWQAMVANLALNREGTARRGFAAYRELHPRARLDNIRSSQPFRNERRVRPLLDTLRELGMPES